MMFSSDLIKVGNYRRIKHESEAISSLSMYPILKKYPAVVFNECEYSFNLLRHTIESLKEFDITVVDEPENAGDSILQIDEYENIDWSRVLSGKMVANAYCVRKGLIRKANYAAIINKYIEKHPKSILSSSNPVSLVISTWDAFDESLMRMGVTPAVALEGLLEEARDLIGSYPADSMWVLKPSLGRKGVDVVLVSGPHAMNIIKTSLLDMPDAREWVLQKYVDRPLLLHRRKFHIRTYILAVGALDVYVFTEMFVLLAFSQFAGATFDDISAHLTNTYQANKFPGFKEEKYVRVLSEMAGMLRKDGVSDAQGKVEFIYRQIREVTANLFHAFKGEFSAFMPLPNAYELYGCDFLVDQDYRVYFLEANPGPDMKLAGDRLEYVIEGIIQGTVKHAVQENAYLAGLKDPVRAPVGPTAKDTKYGGMEAAPIVMPMVDDSSFRADGGIDGRMDLVYSQKWHSGDHSKANMTFG